jgi:hypothetical protein
MDRPGIHDIPRVRLVEHMRAMGLQVEELGPLSRFDFRIDGEVRVTLRTAFPSSYERRIQLGQRTYDYVYRAWNFNFHHRGRIDGRYTDFFLCVPLGDGGFDLERVYVIPWEARTAKTFYLPDSRRPYAGKYAMYRGAWVLLKQDK